MSGSVSSVSHSSTQTLSSFSSSKSGSVSHNSISVPVFSFSSVES